jgi:arylsulfatase A-like enzyme
MRDVDAALGRLLDGLQQRGLLGKMHVLVTSDHGMQPIDLDRYVLLDRDLGLELNRVRVSDWGPAAQIWTLPNGPSADEIVARIGEDARGVRRVWRKGEGPERYHFDDHRRVPDVTVEADLGWMISNQPYYAGMQRGLLNGMHGWDPAWHSMHGIFIAHGPAFEAGERLPAVRSVDLYPLMAELMDVPAADSDGRLAAFQPLLERSAPIGVTETEWRCEDGERYRTRRSPGLVGLAADGLVFALPRNDPERALFGMDGVTFSVSGSSARIEIDGRVSDGCRPTAPVAGSVSRPGRT